MTTPKLGDAMCLLKRLHHRLIRPHNPRPTRFDVHLRILGFPVRVHPTFWLSHAGFAAAVAWVDHLRGDAWWPLAFVLCFAGTMLSVLAHELGHALPGRRFGLYGEVILIDIGGLVRWTHMDYALNLGYAPNRRQRVCLSLGGPAVNLLIATVALTAWTLTGSAGEIYREVANDPNRMPQTLLGCTLLELLVLVLAGVNLVAGVANLVPIPRLDGWWVALEVIGWVRTRGRPNWDTDDPEWWSRA